jgi:membrane-bound ClpP family serine protease
LLTDSERAMNERAVVYGVSAKTYHQAFASSAFFGLLFVVVGAVLLFTDAFIFGAIMIGLGLMFGIRGAGLATAGKKYKSLAAGNRMEGRNP